MHHFIPIKEEIDHKSTTPHIHQNDLKMQYSVNNQLLSQREVSSGKLQYFIIQPEFSSH